MLNICLSTFFPDMYFLTLLWITVCDEHLTVYIFRKDYYKCKNSLHNWKIGNGLI